MTSKLEPFKHNVQSGVEIC